MNAATDKLKVVCVYRSGRNFTPDYVKKLATGVKRNLPDQHEFICLTDRPESIEGTVPAVTVLPLRYDWPGWWAKMEAFSVQGPVLYLDLDTVVTGSLAACVESVMSLGKRFLMLRDYYRPNAFASGVMGWVGDYSWITDLFEGTRENATFDQHSGGFTMRVNGKTYRGDQNWLRSTLTGRKIDILAMQEMVPGVVSYKIHIRDNNNGLPEGTRLVSFHGRPRLHEVNPQPNWLKDNWR